MAKSFFVWFSFFLSTAPAPRIELISLVKQELKHLFHVQILLLCLYYLYQESLLSEEKT